MSENQYGFKYDEYGNTQEILVYGSGEIVNGCNFVNKGTAFSKMERAKLGLQACLPPGVRTLDDQVSNSIETVNAKCDDIERYIFMRSLYSRNVTLTHALIRSDFEKFMNIIYTPTVMEAVKRYSSMFRQANGLHFYPGNIDNAEDILRRYLNRDIRIAVVTDNQGVLSMGDQGVGGIAICLGKLMLYTQGAGIAPWHCLPISLDVGTDNESLLNDEKYLGWRHKRLIGEPYLSFIGRFARAFRTVFPNAICQWEDFSRQNAFSIREAFSDELISFNDDIQGTGAVALAAMLSAMKIKGENLKDQIFMIQGAGTAGIGVAQQIELWLRENGVDPEVAKDQIYINDSDGLITSDKSVEQYKRSFSKNYAKLDWLKKGTPEEIVSGAKITVLIDASTSGDIINERLIESLLKNTNQPVILTSLSSSELIESRTEDLMKWSGSSCLVASGLPFTECGEKRFEHIRQCNNALVFPGVGLGLLASGARQVLPQFFTRAAEIIAKSMTDKDLAEGALLPPLNAFEEIADKIAFGVAMMAVDKGISRPCVYSQYQHLGEESRMGELIKRMRWRPNYLPLVAM